jgi:DNA-binding transcriptional MerR regulator
MKKINKRQNVENVGEAKLNLKGINMKNYQTKLYAEKVRKIAILDEKFAKELLKELKKTGRFCIETLKKITTWTYQNCLIEEIDARIKEENENPCWKYHTLEALAKLRAEKIAKFATEDKEKILSRLQKIEDRGNDYFREENVAAIRKEISENGYLTMKSQKYVWGIAC